MLFYLSIRAFNLKQCLGWIHSFSNSEVQLVPEIVYDIHVLGVGWHLVKWRVEILFALKKIRCNAYLVRCLAGVTWKGTKIHTVTFSHLKEGWIIKICVIMLLSLLCSTQSWWSSFDNIYECLLLCILHLLTLIVLWHHLRVFDTLYFKLTYFVVRGPIVQLVEQRTIT